MTDYDSDYPPRRHRLHRDSERGVILGVCAGIAECFDWPLWLTRIAVLAIGWIFPIPVAIAYAVAALLMPERHLRYHGDADERSFWRRHSHRGDL